MENFAETRVLIFKEMTDSRRSIIVKATPDPYVFKMVRGLTPRDQITDTRMVSREELKQVWIDAVVNGYECVLNSIFPQGVRDCLPPPKLVEPDRIGDVIEDTQN